jgi:hypothetical protein
LGVPAHHPQRDDHLPADGPLEPAGALGLTPSA